MANLVIVDDSPFMVATLKKVFEKHGHNVFASGYDGDQGVQLYSEHRPDVILLDITMPNKSGKQCLEEIIQVDQAACVVIITSVTDEETAKECIDIGAKAYLQKNVNFANPEEQLNLVSKIEQIIEV